ncbi:MAG: hypothetical protein ABIG43_06470 [Chloroflexota bacterium]
MNIKNIYRKGRSTMKRRKDLVLVIIIIFILAACSPQSIASPTTLSQPVASSTTSEKENQVTPTSEPTLDGSSALDPSAGNIVEQFDIFNPYQALTSQEIAQLGADGFSGSDGDIAQSILEWQGRHMQYIGDPNQKPDISHPMRWNYFLPGIFPVSEMIYERVLDNGLIYGLCWDYAAIFSAIANYYELETRVTAYKVYMSDTNPSIDKSTANGMSPDEFALLKPILERHGLLLSYDQISRAARETWSHYRAEVKIDGKWVAFDGAPLATGDTASAEYEIASWDEGYDPDLLYKEVSPGGGVGRNDIDLYALAEALSSAPAPGYEGITDDADNPNRAATMEDLLAGKGLVPYFKDMAKIMDFLQNNIDDLSDCEEIMSLYEEGTGKIFYCIADVMIYTMAEIEAEEYIFLYNALTGGEMIEEEFSMYIE